MKVFGDIRRYHPADGFTIVEVIVSAVIFTLAVAGIFATISALRSPATESSQEVTAAFVGKRILDDMRTEVSALTWSGGSLDPSGSPYALNAIVVDGISYTPTYIVEPDPDGTGARKVTLNVTW